jgi:hypothetical protein
MVIASLSPKPSKRSNLKLVIAFIRFIILIFPSVGGVRGWGDRVYPFIVIASLSPTPYKRSNLNLIIQKNLNENGDLRGIFMSDKAFLTKFSRAK